MMTPKTCYVPKVSLFRCKLIPEIQNTVIAFSWLLYYDFYVGLCNSVVPSPLVTAIAPSTLTIGQSLTLECSVTTVRGITSRVDIIWTSFGTMLRRINDSSQITMSSSVGYTDSYTIQRLCLVEQNEVYQCEVVINTSPPVMATGSVTLSKRSNLSLFIVCVCIEDGNVLKHIFVGNK